ncbi:hypothetical protein BHM03_00023615 [Ensete ventricosum]|nr:hypothetical protein BHM03_00023615 [Ensete ventricosum]
MEKRPVVDDLPRHVLIDLLHPTPPQKMYITINLVNRRGKKRSDAMELAHPVASLDILHGDELLGLLMAHQLRHPEVPRADVPHHLVLLHPPFPPSAPPIASPLRASRYRSKRAKLVSSFRQQQPRRTIYHVSNTDMWR